MDVDGSATLDAYMDVSGTIPRMESGTEIENNAYVQG